MSFYLWKSIYQYNGEFPGSLSFTAGELFLVLRKENEYWFLVCDNDGTIGCIPLNYVEKTYTSNDDIKLFCEKAIKSLSQKTASVINKRDNLIKDLIEFIESTNPVKTKTSTKINESTIPSDLNAEAAPKLPPTSIPKGISFLLTDTIRQSTQSSYQCSKKTLKLMLNVLTEHIPEIEMWTNPIQNELATASQYNLEDLFHQSPDWYNLNELFNYFQQRKNDSQERGWSLHENASHLRKELKKLLKILKMSNRDLVASYLLSSEYEGFLALLEWYQLEQRVALRRLLLQIVIVCCQVNPHCIDVCLQQSVLAMELVRDLMDTNTDCKNFTYATLLFNILISGSSVINVDIKEKLNQNFCHNLLWKLSEYHLTILRNSHHHHYQNCDSFDNCDRNSSSISNNNDTNSNQGDVDCDSETDDNTTGDNKDNNEHNFSLKSPLYMDDVIFSCLLSINKLFTNTKTNPVLNCLQASPEHTQLFVEKLIQAFNRNYDPSALITFMDINQQSVIDTSNDANNDIHSNSNNANCNAQVNSVRKILCDIYSSERLCDIIYRNDARVIIDIIVRQLCDLPTNSTALSEYLLLLDLIITNSDYISQGKYKLYDLKQALCVINQVSLDDVSDIDQELSKNIANKLDRITQS